MTSLDSFLTARDLDIEGARYRYRSLRSAEATLGADVARLPIALRVLLENLLRHEDGETVTADDIRAMVAWAKDGRSDRDIAFFPVRVVMPDSSGVPLIADLAAMRDVVARSGGDPSRVNPLCPVDMVVDHSAVAHHAGAADAFAKNIAIEYADNRERYVFLKWAQQAFRNLRIVPPGAGIIHQVNLEYLSRPIWSADHDGERWAYPDTLVGMDSHTPMINALGVLGWGVGGIEAGSAMLGEPITMLIPRVIGCRLTGALAPGVTSTDLVLAITERLRAKGVVDTIVEFHGPGVRRLPLTDRATIANMAPEYGANMGFFAIDEETIRYLELTGRAPADVALARAYAQIQGLWGGMDEERIRYSDIVEIDLAKVEPSVAGPRRPQDRHPLGRAKASFVEGFMGAIEMPAAPDPRSAQRPLQNGDVVLAAITSCTNTSNPSVMIGAGLLAKKALARGLAAKPWVKTSLSPGSRVVTDYLEASGLQGALDALGFQRVGYGCMTCGGASGALAPEVAGAIDSRKLTVAAVLSANRNFEGRTHPQARAAYLASPPLVVAYAIAGSMLVDVATEPLGADRDGKPVYLRDLWPTDAEIAAVRAEVIAPAMFTRSYERALAGDTHWNGLAGPKGVRFTWDAGSTYLRPPPFSEPIQGGAKIGDIRGAKMLALLGDSITTDHISPVAMISKDSIAATYLGALGVKPPELNSFMARRANHDVMVRGTFGSTRLKNELAAEREGGYTRVAPGAPIVSIYEAAMTHAGAGTPLVVVAGKEYGTGSSRDWAAKGTALLGVRAVIAESFERIHRSNLVGMGVLPMELPAGVTRKTLGLDGSESIDLVGLAAGLAPRMKLECRIRRADGRTETVPLTVRVDTPREVAWCEAGGILRYVMARLGAA